MSDSSSSLTITPTHTHSQSSLFSFLFFFSLLRHFFALLNEKNLVFVFVFIFFFFLFLLSSISFSTQVISHSTVIVIMAAILFRTVETVNLYRRIFLVDFSILCCCLFFFFSVEYISGVLYNLRI